MYMLPSRNPGARAEEYRRLTGTPRVGPITTSMTLGGIRIPSVPPAAIAPADSFAS